MRPLPATLIASCTQLGKSVTPGCLSGGVAVVASSIIRMVSHNMNPQTTACAVPSIEVRPPEQLPLQPACSHQGHLMQDEQQQPQQQQQQQKQEQGWSLEQKHFMQLALEQARAALKVREVPIG